MMVSIIVPVYNNEKYLQRCLDSIQCQTYTDFEVIIVDDGSTDGSGSICDNMARKDSRFHIIHQNNSGVSIARNVALAYARGDVTFIDADDYVEPNYLKKLKNALEYYEVDIAYCEWKEEDEKQNIIAVNDSLGEKKDVIIDSYEIDWNIKSIHPTVWGAIFRKDIISEISFDERFFWGEDTLFEIQCVKNAKKLYFIHDAFFHYVLYQVSDSRGGFNLKKLTGIAVGEEICKLYHNSSAESLVIADQALNIKNFCCNFYKDSVFIDNGCLNELILKYRKIQKIYFKELVRSRKYKQLVTGILFGICPKLFLEIREEKSLLKTKKR